MRCMLKKFRSCILPGVEQLCLLAELWYSIVWDKQETQLSQRDRAMLLVIECFVKSLKFTHGHSKRHCWLGHVPISISLKLCLYVYHFWDIQASASKMAWFWNRGRVRSKSLKMAPFDRSHDFLLVRKYSSILYRFWVIWRCRDLVWCSTTWRYWILLTCARQFSLWTFCLFDVWFCIMVHFRLVHSIHVNSNYRMT